jgi:hypothetical protein
VAGQAVWPRHRSGWAAASSRTRRERARQKPLRRTSTEAPSTHRQLNPTPCAPFLMTGTSGLAVGRRRAPPRARRTEKSHDPQSVVVDVIGVDRSARRPRCAPVPMGPSSCSRAAALDELQSSAPAPNSPLLSAESERPCRQWTRRTQWRNSDLARTPTTLTEPRRTPLRVVPYTCPPAPTRSAQGRPVISDVILRKPSGKTERSRQCPRRPQRGWAASGSGGRRAAIMASAMNAP